MSSFPAACRQAVTTAVGNQPMPSTNSLLTAVAHCLRAMPMAIAIAALGGLLALGLVSCLVSCRVFAAVGCWLAPVLRCISVFPRSIGSGSLSSPPYEVPVDLSFLAVPALR